ncbi:protein NETWORKED 2A [Ziziphus jujuba]|uniref:Protein NETWORKED 2A n=1 Tax=Ziziphus jujuba TaxID=326968 RepID=A0ABM3IM36_ZIZJJ|nr:protein NETWORKED 2A [Ziziphus jujuba]
MLHRAASNAYSWWWASHVRTKQSKWLEENLQDMEEKVTITLKIVDDDGDSFAQRAEMYYRKRPELINFIEDSFRAYRALAERYDSLSRELQSANRTIATVFPERVQYAMADDEEENSSETSTSSGGPNKPTEGSPSDSKSTIPKVPKIPKKDFRSPSRLTSRKGYEPLKRMASSAKTAAIPISGLNKTEALQEIDKLQKGILALQTEKEFVKCMYEHGYQKYWDIENQITEMQKKVSSLQDEFGIGTIIEDNEARTLMAATAMKSCQETLVKLQEKQGQSEEETRVENRRINEAHEKFETIKDEFLSKHKRTEEFELLDGEISSKALEKHEHDCEMLRKTIMEQLEMNSSNSPITVTEMAEKIDELVNKVVILETSVSSQSSLVKRLRSETDELHAHIRSLEEEKETLMESSERMSKKLQELEEELRRVKILNRNVEDENNNLRTHFTEASCNLDHLSDKLQTVKQDEEVDEHRRLFQKVRAVPDHAKPDMESGEDKSKHASDDEYSVSKEVIKKEEEEKKDEESFGLMSEKSHEPIHNQEEEEEEEGKEELSEMVDNDVDGKQQELEEEKEEENQPNWRQMFLKGLEDREKILLEEYTSVLQDYKEVRKKLSEVENKNRDGIFELAMQVRDLKHHIATKDEEIKCLQHKANFQQASNPDESPSACSTEYKYANLEPQSAHSPYHHGSPSLNLDESIYQAGEHEKFTVSPPMKDQKITKKKRIPKSHTVSTIEERLRSNIDELLEENLEFWLRFSTSVHQIQKFQTSIDDLESEFSLLMNKRKEEGGTSSKQHSLQSDARPIYRHLREIKTELSLWLEHNAVLKDELEDRFSSLCNIQDEISRISDASSKLEKIELSDYQAAKFQGEVRNMKQENNKVVEELQVGLNRVKALKVQVEKTLSRMDVELGISPLKNSHPTMKQAANRVRIPLRSFLFGVKLKRQKPSIFSCVSPAVNKHSNLPASAIPPS